jgi:hypothetical protein
MSVLPKISTIITLVLLTQIVGQRPAISATVVATRALLKQIATENACNEKLEEKLKFKPVSASGNFHFKNPEEELLVQSAFKLRQFVDNHYDFEAEKTNLEVLRPLLISIRTHLADAISPEFLAQRKEIYVFSKERIALNANYLEKLILEIDDHLAHKQITYEWINSLPLRAGYFLQMPSQLELQSKNFIDQLNVESYLNFSDYLIFEKVDRDYRLPRNTDVGNLRLPGFGDLSREAINHMIARRVWPTNMVKQGSNADHEDMSTLGFPEHDNNHELASYFGLNSMDRFICPSQTGHRKWNFRFVRSIRDLRSHLQPPQYFTFLSFS